MPMILNYKTEFPAGDYPRLYKTLFSYSTLTAVYIAQDSNTLLLMPVDEAVSWVIVNCGGELSNMKVVYPSTDDVFFGFQYSVKRPHFIACGNGPRSLKDKEYSMDITRFNLKRKYSDMLKHPETLTPDDWLAVIATRAFQPI